jgi:hypothetical protein
MAVKAINTFPKTKPDSFNANGKVRMPPPMIEFVILNIALPVLIRPPLEFSFSFCEGVWMED